MGEYTQNALDPSQNVSSASESENAVYDIEQATDWMNVASLRYEQ